MKSCCDEMCSSNGCNQGRNCPAREVPSEMEDAQPAPFELIGDFVIAGCIAIGVVVCIGIAVLSLMGVVA